MSDAPRRLAVVLLCIALAACTPGVVRPAPPAADVGVQAFVDSLQGRTFAYFWETTNPRNGLAPDRVAMRERHGDDLYTRYGFLDAFNPTLKEAGVRLLRGDIVTGKGWFDDNYIGIDQGPIVAMIENHRSELLWNLMKKNPYIVRGLCRAGFTGGWIEGRCN